MILVVAGRDAPRGLPDRPVVRVPDGDAVAAVEGQPSLVVVDCCSVPDGDAVVRSLVDDDRYADVPILAVGDVETDALREFDEFSPSAEADDLSDAAERALAFSDYSEAVDALYAACRDRAVEGAAPLERTDDVTAALREADDRLGRCDDPTAALRALLARSGGGSKDS